jgi:hypothetical protein
MGPTLLSIIEDFGRLWNVQGFAPLFALRLADPPARSDDPLDPCGVVLEEHRRFLLAALKRAQRRAEISSSSDLGTLADGLLGLYLTRRLRGDGLEGWVDDAMRLAGGSPCTIDPEGCEETHDER